MVGRVFITPATEPFFLGTRHHTAIMENLRYPVMGERRNLHTLLAGKLARCKRLRERSMYTPAPFTESGSPHSWFYKILRWDAFSPEYFVELYRVYKQYAVLAASADFPTSLVPAQLLFGEYQVAIRMPFLVGTRPPKQDELEDDTNREWHVAIACSLVYLARHGLLYTDLRPANILVTTHDVHDRMTNAYLIDYDDMVALEEHVQNSLQFQTLLQAKAPERHKDPWAEVMPYVETSFAE